MASSFDIVEKKQTMDQINYHYATYNSFVKALTKTRDRMERNFRKYSGVDLGQWDDDATRILLDEKRPITTFNLIQKYIDMLQAMLEENPFDVQFDSITPEGVDEVNIMQQLYEYDFNRGNWEIEKTKFRLNGLIFMGCLEMFIDYKNDSLGNIGIKSLNPSHVLYDPYWQSDDERDCRMVYKWSWMTASQIKDIYSTKSDDVDSAIRMNAEIGENHDEELYKLVDRSGEFFDQLSGRYKVIECIYMKTVKSNKIFNKKEGQFVEYQSKEIENMMMKIQGEALTVVPESRDICKVFTFCPALSRELILAEGEHPVQVGRLPFFFWSEKNLFGERQGMVDVLNDAQETLNKREAAMTHWQTTSSNGHLLVEEDAFVDNSAFDTFVRTLNVPGTVSKVASGSLREGKIAPLVRGQMPVDLIQSAQRAEQFMEKASSVVAAVQGQSGGSNESGILHEQKRMAATAPVNTLNKFLRATDNNMAECYFYLAKQVYKGVPRVFKGGKNNQLIAINQPTSWGTFNDIENLPRMNVMILESKAGVNKKREELSKFIELSRTTQNPIARSFFEFEQFKYLDLPESTLQEITEKSKVFVDMQVAQVQSQMAQLQASMQQLGMPAQPTGVGDEMVSPLQASIDGSVPSPRAIAASPGQGNLPVNIAGGENVSNNREAPSAML